MKEAELIQSLSGHRSLRAAEALPEIEEHTEQKVKDAFEKNWSVIVWNDPVNLMSYVVFVFMKVMAFPKEKATKHMLEVHQQGRNVSPPKRAKKPNITISNCRHTV